MTARMWALVAVGVGALGSIGCQGAPTSEGKSGYLLVDRDARNAGFAVEIAGEKIAPVLPMQLTSDDEATLVGPTGRMALSGDADELLWVRGAAGKIESLAVGDEIADDELKIEGSEDAANQLAQQLAADIEASGEATWKIHVADALRVAAAASAPDGLVGALPSEKAAPVEEEEAAARARIEGRGVGLHGLGRGMDPTRFSSKLIDRVLDDYGLPPAVTCEDPVAGTWMTQDYDDRYGDWYIFTMHVQRKGTDLVGDIEAHSWDGSTSDTKPPSCDGRSHWTVGMSARGSLLADGSMHFGGTSWHTDKLLCGAGPWGYNLDHFTGTLDGSHFSSVNNDGGRMIDRASPFRRISCR